MKLTKTEPVALQGAVTAVLSGIVAVCGLFGWWEPDTKDVSILAGLLSTIIVAGTAFARGRVWPEPHVAQEVLVVERQASDAQEERDAALRAMAEAQEALQANARAQADYWAGKAITEVDRIAEPPAPVSSLVADTAERMRSSGLLSLTTRPRQEA